MRTTRRVLLAVVVAVIFVADLYVLGSLGIVQVLTNPERRNQQDSPGNYGLRVEAVEFTSRDTGLQLSGWYLGGTPDAPHLIFVHGVNGVRSSSRALELAARLTERGYGVLMFDLRGHGSSDGGLTSAGYYERQDVWGAYDYLTQSRGVAVGNVGLVGFSMGAATAILAAAGEPGIRAVVADSPYAAATELIAAETARSLPLPEWFTPVFVPAVSLLAFLRYGIDVGALAPEQAVTRLDYPILVIHGDSDVRIPVNHGQRVADAGPPGSILWRVEDPGHATALAARPAEYAQRVVAYLEGRFE